MFIPTLKKQLNNFEYFGPNGAILLQWIAAHCKFHVVRQVYVWDEGLTLFLAAPETQERAPEFFSPTRICQAIPYTDRVSQNPCAKTHILIWWEKKVLQR